MPRAQGNLSAQRPSGENQQVHTSFYGPPKTADQNAPLHSMMPSPGPGFMHQPFPNMGNQRPPS